MKKIEYTDRRTICPYRLKIRSIKNWRTKWRTNLGDDFIYLEGACHECQYHVNQKSIFYSFVKHPSIKRKLESGYVICKYSNFSEKLEIIKRLLK